MTKVLHVQVGKEPQVVNVDFENFGEVQKLIGDEPMVQAVRLEDSVFLYCDDDGISKELPQNRLVPSIMESCIFGDFFLVKQSPETNEEVDLTEEDIKKWTKILSLENSKA